MPRTEFEEPEREDKTPEAKSLRLDRWLWFARVAKTRSACQRLIRKGAIRVNRQRIKTPSHLLHIGDVLTIALPHKVRIVQVKAFGARRGPAVEAARLYVELTPQTQTPPAAGVAPITRTPAPQKCPDKRARRDLRKLKNIQTYS